MTIEVKQMLVKSSVQSGRAVNNTSNNQALSENLAEIRADILNQCKQMIIDVLREQQER